ncbi:MAG: BREX system ATP-binding domain-containing protein [Acidimicrobiales bacterium]
MIGVEEYTGFLGEDYLRGYVEGGGAAVKFTVVPDDAVAASLATRLGGLGREAGYVVATVDASVTRVHLLEQVFFEVARQVDWDGLAAKTARRALEGAGYPVPPGSAELSLERVAAHHGVDARELKRDVDRDLQGRVYRDYAMVQEFRIAMLRLCQAQLHTGQVADAEQTAVLDWLKGDLRQISALKSALIFRRIGRHNARQMLFSLAHWLAVNGRSGLLLTLDVRRFGMARRPAPEERQGYYYTRGALLDAYEVLRQLVDNTDELAHCFVVVVAAPEFLSDQSRGLNRYQALKLRIFDEVRDRNRDNPFSSLVRLGVDR